MPDGAVFVPFTAQTRMSGVDVGSARRPQGRASTRCASYVEATRRHASPAASTDIADFIARRGSTPLVVVDTDRGGQPPTVRVLGVVELKDIVKPGLKERFGELRRMGIRTVMITGDNRSRPRPSRPRPASTTSSPRPRPR